MKYNKLERNEQNLKYIAEGKIENLITSNTLYIYKLVSKLPIDDTSIQQDLIQEGRIAIFKASQTFKPEEGTPFMAYAKHYIKKAIFEYLQKYQNTIKIPANLFWNAENHIPTISTAIQLNDNTNSTVEDLLSYEVEDISIDDNQQMQYKAIYSRFNELKPQQRMILSNYVGLDPTKDKMTFAQIGEILGISKEAVRQQYNYVIKKMRNEK